MSDSDKSEFRFRIMRLLAFLFTVGLTLCLVFAVISLPSSPTGLADHISANISKSGVINPVTAVLLNFRGYDTLLEIGVLLLAVFGVWALPASPHVQVFSSSGSGPILLALVRLFVPLMIVVAGYFLWAGSHGPGGAFQGGAVLGAAAVLIFLSGLPLPGWIHHWRFRAVLVMGFLVFLTVGVGTMVADGAFLEYPDEWAGHLILLVEATLTLSIGGILAGLFLGGPPATRESLQPREHP